jgi:hypothetical protein
MQQSQHPPAPHVPTHIPIARPTKVPPLTSTNPPTIYPPTKPTMPFKTHLVPTYIEPDNDDRDDIHLQPTLLAIQFHSPCGPANILHQVLYHVINLAFNTCPAYTIPQALSKSPDRVHHIINIKEVCNDVIHPVTKETIMKYNNLMNNPDLKNLWVPAMSNELHRLAQGKVGITAATNTIFFLSHEKISRIPKDHTVTYARIVINHQPQKDDPNCICITVGGNLINYPYKLTT